MPKISPQQKEAVRMEILKAAKNIFIEKGYESTSMKEIVECSGRSFGGVYLYYSNKEDVFLDLLRRQFGEMEANFTVDKPVHAWEALVRFFEEQERRSREAENGLAPCMYEYFIVGRRDEKRRLLIDERHRAVYESVASLIQGGVERGELHPSQPVETIAHWFISFLNGIFMESIMNGSERIQLSKQFELLRFACRSILVPSGMEE